MARRPPGSRLFMNPAPYEEADSAWRAARRSSPSWRAPERVLSVHPSDQLADIFRYRWPSWLAAPDLPGSKTEGSLFGARRSASQSKPLTVRPRRTGPHSSASVASSSSAAGRRSGDGERGSQAKVPSGFAIHTGRDPSIADNTAAGGHLTEDVQVPLYQSGLDLRERQSGAGQVA